MGDKKYATSKSSKYYNTKKTYKSGNDVILITKNGKQEWMTVTKQASLQTQGGFGRYVRNAYNFVKTLQ